MSNRKIFIYVPNLAGGGTERFFTQLASLLALNERYSITYFYSVNFNKYKNISNNDFLTFRKTISNRSIFAVWEVIYNCWKQKPSLILSAQNHPNVLFSILKCFLPKETDLVISERSFTHLALNDAAFWPRKILNKMIPISYKNADYIHCLTERIKFVLVNNYNLPEEKIIVIPNFVDLENVKRKSEKNIKFHVFNQNFLDFPYMVSIGRLHNQKGYKYLIDAYSRIHKKIPHKLIILGEGPLINDLKKQVEKNNLKKKIIFGGFIKNPYPILKNADLFVLSSLYEGMPNALLEAISLEVPIISSDCPSGPREILGEEYKCLLYDPLDVQRLSELMLRQIVSPLKIPNTILSKRFTVEKIVNAYEKLIISCL